MMDEIKEACSCALLEHKASYTDLIRGHVAVVELRRQWWLIIFGPDGNI